MKVLVALLGLITTITLSGEATTVSIRANNATKGKHSFTLGSRVILTCHVQGIPTDSEVALFKWYHICNNKESCKIKMADAYYKVADDTLLVDVMSGNQSGWYYCKGLLKNNQSTMIGNTQIEVTDNTSPYLFTPISILLENTPITNIKQITGNEAQKITCIIGRGGVRAEMYREGSAIPLKRGYITTMQLNKNGQYYCWDGSNERIYFNIFTNNFTALPTPVVHTSAGVWTFTSPDGSRVKGYIVEFGCRVRKITFVEKYMNVSVDSERTGQVATSESCFRGLGQLYRMKVWAVSGPNISQKPAVRCLTSGGQCKEEGTTGTTQGNTDTSPGSSTPDRPSSPETDHANMQEDGSQSAIGTFIGVGVGVGVITLLVLLLTVVVIILVVVMMGRNAAYKQKGDKKEGDNLYYNNTVVVKQEVEMTEKGLGADYDYADNEKCEEKGSIVDGFDPYEDPDRKAQNKTAMKQDSQESATLQWETDAGDVYTVVDKTKKKGAKKKETEDERAVTNKDDLYAMPMKKKGKMMNNGIGVVESGDVEQGDENDNKADLQYEPMADSESGQQNEGEGNAPNVDALYAVVNKSRKKKK